MYKTLSQPYLASSRAGSPAYWYLHDAPKTKNNQKILERYIADAHDIFIKKTAAVADFKKTVTLEDEKHLYVMLELLIEARRIWEEEPR